MQFEKQIKIIILTIAILTFFSCGESESQRKEKNRLAKIQENESKFYYPESHDKWWRFYEPNLIGAEGWIISDCNGQKYPNDRVSVAQLNLLHIQSHVIAHHLYNLGCENGIISLVLFH